MMKNKNWKLIIAIKKNEHVNISLMTNKIKLQPKKI